MKLLTPSLIISILGILFLLILANTIKPHQVNNYQQLSQLKLNSLATTTGKIIKINNYDDFNIIKLDNNLTLTCNKCQFQVNQTITATGIITTYQNQLQIQANKINIFIN